MTLLRKRSPEIRRPQRVAVLGAGPAGLAVAHELSANGVDVTVFERNSFVGGLARTTEHRGYRFDLGGHRWFTKNQSLDSWFNRLMAGELIVVKRTSRIFHEGKYYSYPIRPKEIVAHSGFLMTARIVASVLWTKLRNVATNQPVVTMEDAFTAQFGSSLYEMFFRRYSEKVWGFQCSELSSDWVAQRSRGLSIWELVRDAVLGPRPDVVSLTDQFKYPRLGYGRICERLADDVIACGNPVLLGCAVTKLVYDGPSNMKVIYCENGREKSARFDMVVSTIPLSHLILMLQPSFGSKASAAARSLRFRDLITVNLILRRSQVSSDTWLYIQDENIIFGRMHEPKNWSASMVPDDGHTSLVLECFCSKGDGIWNMTDDALARRCIEDLVKKLKFISADDVEDVLVTRARDAYPIYDLEYREKLAIVNAHLENYAGLHVVGRGGTFRYNNADHSLEMGLLLARNLLGEDADPKSVNTEMEYQEEMRVRIPT